MNLIKQKKSVFVKINLKILTSLTLLLVELVWLLIPLILGLFYIDETFFFWNRYAFNFNLDASLKNLGNFNLAALNFNLKTLGTST